MKAIKKIFAVVLVVSMMMSLVSIGASAATQTVPENFEITYKFRKSETAQATDALSIKANKKFYVDIYATPFIYDGIALSIVPGVTGITSSDVTVNVTGAEKPYVNSSTGLINIVKSSGEVVVDATTPIATIAVTIPEGTEPTSSLEILKPELNKYSGAYYTDPENGDGWSKFSGTAANVAVAVMKSFTATKAATSSTTATYEIGTNVAAELAKLDVTVKGDNAGEEESGYTAVWTTTATDLTVPTGDTPITFTGTVSDSQVNEDNAASWTGDLTTTVAVTLTAIAGDSTDVEAVEKVEIRKTETALAAGDITKELPSTLKVAKNGIEDTVDVVWTATPDATFGTVEGATLEVTGALAATSTNSKFTFDNKTVNATVEIIPATIANASIAIKNNSIYAIPQITITVPAKEIKPDNVVTEGEGEGATEVSRTGVNEIKVTLTQESGDPIVLTASALKYNDFTFSGEGDDAVATYTVTGVKSLNKLGVESGEDVTISATLNKAELVVGTENVTDEEGKVTGTKDVTSVGITASKPISGSAAGIKPGASINNNSQNNQTGAGTTTPGTETPGTETPGTETPGTDAPVVEGLFEDVAADHWAAEAIATLKDAGIVGGVTATTFAPDADITRAEFTKMIAGLLKLDATSTEVAFEDCGADDWFTPYVAAAVEAGLVTGVSETEFAPDATITREQAFTIIGRAIAAAEVNTTLTYADAAEISEYAVPYVTLLTQEGIVGGFADNTVRPQANITRAEAAKVIAGLMGIVVTEEEVAEEEAVEEETVEEETVEE